MRLLYVTHFFPPEKGAAANRAYRITKGLIRKGVFVDILTGFPNYPDGKLPQEYRLRGTTVEYTDYGAKIIRVPMQPAASADPIWFRLINQISFPVNALLRQRVLHDHYDVVMASSPPLFTGLLGYLLSEKLNAKFVLDVRDLWPEAGMDVLTGIKRMALLPFRYLANFLYGRAYLITMTADTMIEKIKERFPDQKYLWLPNGMFQEEINSYRNITEPTGECVLISSGLLGRMQDNKLLRDLAEIIDKEKYQLHIAGGGAESYLFEDDYIKSLDHVVYHGVLPYDKVLSLICSSHIGLALWKDVDASKYVVPMRVVEYLSLGRPVVLSVPTAVGKWIEKYQAGVIASSDIDAVKRAIDSICFGGHYKEYATNATRLAKDLFDMDYNIEKLLDTIR